jgi:hypothetical protein
MKANQRPNLESQLVAGEMMIGQHQSRDVEDGSPTETERFIVDTLLRLDEAEAEASHLKRALHHSRDIGAAVGVLMSRHRVTQEEAFQLLRRASQDQNRKLHEISLDVLRVGELSAREP